MRLRCHGWWGGLEGRYIKHVIMAGLVNVDTGENMSKDGDEPDVESEAISGERGAKWWFKYVIVPLLSSGGVIAIIAAGVMQWHKPDSGTVNGPAVIKPQPSQPTPPEQVPIAPTKTTEPASASLEYFYLQDDDGKRFEGDQLHLPYDKPFTLRWKVNYPGVVLLSSDSEDFKTPNEPVDPQGSQHFECYNNGMRTENGAYRNVELWNYNKDDGSGIRLARIYVICDDSLR
jgi:hypothetical protein